MSVFLDLSKTFPLLANDNEQGPSGGGERAGLEKN